MKCLQKMAIAAILMLQACIGTDLVDDPIVGSRIVNRTDQLALLIGTSDTLSINYFDQYGIPQNPVPTWIVSNNSVAEVDAQGLVYGISAGQTSVRAQVGGTTGPPILITVVNNSDEIANVTISTPQGNQLSVGSEISLALSITNLGGMAVEGENITWHSDNEEVLTINNEGVLSALSTGFANVYAVVDGIESNMLGFVIGNTSRTGVFQSAGGYSTEGSAELFINDSGQLILRLSEDFETDFALGTYVYLSNSTGGGATAAQGVEIAEITTNGAKIFNVSNVDANIGIDDFQYVIILCKPASLTFGFAQLD